MSVGSVETPAVDVTADLIANIVSTGGYIHRLFNPLPCPGTADRVPLPGQGVLLLAGGLVEQSGVLDDAIALLELRKASFGALVHAGDILRVRVEPGQWRRTSAGKVVQTFEWEVLNGVGGTVARVSVVMLMNSQVED